MAHCCHIICPSASAKMSAGETFRLWRGGQLPCLQERLAMASSRLSYGFHADRPVQEHQPAADHRTRGSVHTVRKMFFAGTRGRTDNLENVGQLIWRFTASEWAN